MDATELLSQIRIPDPCPVPWGEMTGDERVRFCRQCGRHVYKLARMSSEDGARLLAARGDDLCVQIARRDDGSLVTADAGVVSRRSAWSRSVEFLAPVWAGILLLTGCVGRPPPWSPPRQDRGRIKELGGKVDCRPRVPAETTKTADQAEPLPPIGAPPMAAPAVRSSQSSAR